MTAREWIEDKLIYGQRDLVREARLGAAMLAMAVAVGVVGGFGAVAFRKLIAVFHNLAFEGDLSAQYNTLVHTITSPWGMAIIAVPVIGSLIVTFLVRNFAPEAKGHGVPEVIDAIHYKRGQIRPSVALIKALASSISIGTGGAVGREGPIIQIGATFGALLARWSRIPEWERLALIACGGGAGIAATFNTPIGGVLFACEILLVEISARTLIPVMLATGTASLIGRIFLGDHASFILPPSTLIHGAMGSGWTIPFYVLLGLLAGLVAVFYTRMIYWFEALFQRFPVNDYLRHALGMLLVGVIMYLLFTHLGHYYIEGVGYATVQDILNQTLHLGGLLLLMLMVLKMIATALTLGSGASGGVFSPALFIGATLGAAFAAGMHALFPSVHISVVNAAVIGMACVVGASTGAAITAVVMIFEMTRDYRVIIPVIIGVSMAYSIYHLLLVDTIYTLKLSRRGQRVPTAIQSQLYLGRRALEFIRAPFLCLAADDTVGTALEHRPSNPRMPRVVLLEAGEIVGVVPARALRSARHGDLDTPLRDLADPRILVVESSIQVFDLIADLRRDCFLNAVMTRNGQFEDARSVLGVVTWEDLVEFTNLSDYLDGDLVAKT